MAAQPQLWSRFIGGIADFPREGIADSFAFDRSIDIRTDPQNFSVLPRTIKESGNVVVDLIKWMETVTTSSATYMYGNAGTLYLRTHDGDYSYLRTVNNSHGNGLVYSQEDNFLYFTRDTTIGHYGPLNATTPTFVDDFLSSLGGTPQNTYSVEFLSASSQYAEAPSSPTTQDDISIDLQIKPYTFPTIGNTMALVGKWTDPTNRSYLFDIKTIAGFFGDGSNGPLIINSNQTETVIDSAFSGAINQVHGSATNASFAVGQQVLIHQTYGSGAGTKMRNSIVDYTAGDITFAQPLNATYSSGAQIRVLKQYTVVTVNAGITWTAKAWNGTVGGILEFLANESFTNNGTIVGTGKGFRGGAGLYVNNSGDAGTSGEGTDGLGIASSDQNANGGGGGSTSSTPASAPGGGGGNGTIGQNGINGFGTYIVGKGGLTAGAADLTTASLGGGGGGGVATDPVTRVVGDGGNGGCYISINAPEVTNTGSILNNGAVGGLTTDKGGAGGGGGGGSTEINTQTGILGSGLIQSIGGVGGAAEGSVMGGTGGNGRNHISYYNSYTGTTTPTIDATQDLTLVENVSQQLRFSISDNGSNTEVLSQVTALQLNTWQQVGVTWDASGSVATFYLNAVPIGTKIGTITQNLNLGTLRVAASTNSIGTVANFYNGLMDEVRLFNNVRTDKDMQYGLVKQIVTNTAGLKEYHKLNNSYADATSNSYDLTAHNSPTFETDVPFSSPETRLDIDQTSEPGTYNSTYDVPQTISETSANKLLFTPEKDPQKSILLNIVALGAGSLTITIHDAFNNVMDAITVANNVLNTGEFEFVFDTVWRPLTNFTNEYHAHITSPNGGTTIKTSSSNDFSTAYFKTFYQFLVEDTAWHPGARMLNYLVFGNERYVAKFESPLYEPNKIVLEAGERVRSFAHWNEYLAFGIFRGENVYDFDKGRIYFWDGISPTFNYSIEIEEGGINAMIGTRGKLFIWAGYKNQLLMYQGGNQAVKLRDMPLIEAASYTEIFPQAVCVWESLLRYGVSGNSNSSTLQKGVYTYGSTNLRYPEVLTYDYPISTTNYTGTSLNIGSTAVVNRKLLIGWQDGKGFGVDYVDNSNPPFASARMQLLIYDAEAIWKQKEAVELVAYTSALRTGEMVALSYSLDGSTSFIPNPDTPSVGDTVIRQLITNGRYYEAQIQLDITSVTTAPTIKGVVLATNINKSEDRF